MSQITEQNSGGSPDSQTTPDRIVIVVSDSLSPGHAANAAAIVSLAAGGLLPNLSGQNLVDGAGREMPGLYPSGLPVLKASPEDLGRLRERASTLEGIVIVAFPTLGQQTTDYDAFRTAVAEAPAGELQFAAVMIMGPQRPVRKLTGSFGLLR